MNEDKIKDAFIKAKQDIINLYAQLEQIKREILLLKEHIKIHSSKQTIQQTDSPAHFPTQNAHIGHKNNVEKEENTTVQHINPTSNRQSARYPADNIHLKPLKNPNIDISTGNEGVPTDRQTNQQTVNSTGNEGVKVRLNQNIGTNRNIQTNLDKIERLSELLSSLDDIKKDLRQKFKKLTKQEMTIFSTIYQLEEEGFIVDYSLIAKKLSLTESSIRDYAQRLIKKGIPLIKTKENNKKIFISISQELKKIASLSTIIQLREI